MFGSPGASDEVAFGVANEFLDGNRATDPGIAYFDERRPGSGETFDRFVDVCGGATESAADGVGGRGLVGEQVGVDFGLELVEPEGSKAFYGCLAVGFQIDSIIIYYCLPYKQILLCGR